MAKVRAEYANVDNVPLTKLHLDTQNPRHNPIEDEDRIIAQLWNAEKVLAVAKDIAAKGGINPLDRIGVIELEGAPGHYVVVEGNRRTCALKLLLDPRKAPDTKARAALENLRASSTVADRFPIVVFRDRKAAEPWLRLRHLGDQGGIGTRPWSTAAKNRFAEGDTPDRLSVAVLDRAEEAGWIDATQRAAIPVTTLRRYLGNPVVRAAIGLGSPRDLLYTHDPEQVDRALRHFVYDAIPDESGVAKLNSRSNAANWRAYGQTLHSNGISPTTPLPSPQAPRPPIFQGRIKSARNPRSPDDRKYILPTSFVVSKVDKNLVRIVNELRSIPIDEAPFAVNYLVRAAVERVMVLYALKNGFHNPGLSDHVLVQKCQQHLEANGVHPNKLKTMKVAGSSRDSTYSMDTLGAAVHGAQLPTRKGLIAVWDNWEPSLKLMLDLL